ncbi:heme-degrading domain-containing protein [Naasia lichenicola]|uniref:Heme-degrading domain-containing protein n=1 Tax=Naasia lichenicola TaxID=2565933 RepID=A0A4S4FIE0_9MICO|nr:heme-degrading domain-containing protein [Naasia lichenicola]THG29624.1 heme-degrading domain-containing protein [Naasia lichenicola]
MSDADDLTREIEAQQERLVFSGFDHDDAWRLGSILVERAGDKPVLIDIRRPGLILFRAARTGSTPDNEEWVRRKTAGVFRFETSSMLLQLRFAALGTFPASIGWFDPAQIATAGGSFPIRVAGVGVVAAATVSGLSSEEDHRLVVDAISEFLGV